MTPNDAYNAVAAEMNGDRTADQATLELLEPATVDLARRYARTSHKRWPPHPTNPGWQVTITSIR